MSLAGAVVAIIVAACSPTPSQPELSDPREILARTIETTAALRTMRVRLDAVSGPVGRPPSQSIAAEAVIDLAAGELSATGRANDGSGQGGLIVADGALYMTSSNGRWSKTPMAGALPAMLFGGGSGVAPNVPAALLDLADDPETEARLEGTVDCETGRCYHTRVVLPPAQVWKLVLAATGMGAPPGGGNAPHPLLERIQPVGIDVLTDTATLRLVDLVLSVTLNDNTGSARLRVADPNEPVEINPPPAGLVEDAGPFPVPGGGGVVGPAPVPVPAPASAAPAPETPGP